MRKLLIAAAVASATILAGCESTNDDMLKPEVAKQIMENRIKYAKEIREANLECLKNSNNNRDVHYNDSEEVVEACKMFSQSTYLAYSQYYDSFLLKQAAKAK